MQVLFEREQHPAMGDIESAVDRYAEQVGEYDKDFAHLLLSGATTNEQAVRSALQQHAPQWPLDRMDPISRCTLLVGAFELLFHKDAPPAVVMNEAIEIAKEYGTDEGAKFVNGVLNAIAHAQ